MNKYFFTILLLLFCIFCTAQYNSIDVILTQLEERKGINKKTKNLQINGKKFLLIQDFEDHTERNFIIINDKKITYVEIFDDKLNSTSVSKVYSGDIKITKKNIVSIYADLLEGKKIAIPIAKNFLLTSQENIIYLIDINTKMRWIDESVFRK